MTTMTTITKPQPSPGHRLPPEVMKKLREITRLSRSPEPKVVAFVKRMIVCHPELSR